MTVYDMDLEDIILELTILSGAVHENIIESDDEKVTRLNFIKNEIEILEKNIDIYIDYQSPIRNVIKNFDIQYAGCSYPSNSIQVIVNMRQELIKKYLANLLIIFP